MIFDDFIDKSLLFVGYHRLGSEFAFKQSQKKQLEEVIAKRKDKKNSFAMGKQNVVNTANMNNAMMTQMSGDRE